MCHNLRLHEYSPGGEIGRLRGLKIPRRKACRFESGPGHHLWKPSNHAGSKRTKANLHGLAFFLVCAAWAGSFMDSTMYWSKLSSRSVVMAVVLPGWWCFQEATNASPLRCSVAKTHALVSPCATASRSAALMRVCQPCPVALKASSTSASTRMFRGGRFTAAVACPGLA